jgi:two-component system LytT family response regulator
MKALVVDDEQFCRENLTCLIKEYCPEIRQVVQAADADAARMAIEAQEPDVLFLDIRMPKETGFELLQSINTRHMRVVFTTAHSEYALQALKAGAVDYLEKPISIDDLQEAVRKLHRQSTATASGTTEALKQTLRQAYSDPEIDRIAIPMREGYEILPCRDIVHLEASESYTTIYLADGKRVVSSKNIKVYEDKLNPAIFMRVHKSHIINMRYHLKGFHRIDGNAAVLSNGKHIPIARRKVQSFLDRIAGL